MQFDTVSLVMKKKNKRNKISFKGRKKKLNGWAKGLWIKGAITADDHKMSHIPAWTHTATQ